jgi:hydroxyacylglutathione hydrolase
VEPGNRAAQQKLAQVRKMRGAGRFTTPSTLEEEWSTNPFMRCDNEEIIARVKKEDPANDLRPESVLGAVRRMKDSF